MSRRILFLDTVHPILKENLEKEGFECDEDYSCSREELQVLIPKYLGLVIRSRFTIDKEILEGATNLKFIARSGSGMENIDVEYAEKRGIQCINSPEGNRDAVGEHVIGMLLSLFNNINTSDVEIRGGKWIREGNRGLELGGKTVGIIGYGNTGSALVKKLKGFDCKILANDNAKHDFSDDYVEECSMEVIFKEADIVSLHIPQNADNHYFANEAFFSSFKKEIYFVNTSRGKVLKTDALVDALKSRKVLGACLDVLEYELESFEKLSLEDLPESFLYLTEIKNVILTPHVAGWTVESNKKLASILFDKIKQSL